MVYDYIVIGAGVGGLSFAALMEKKGYKVALLEAHSLPGGCASYYTKNGNTFDVGATTLSGLLPGRSLDILIKDLDLKLELRKIDPGIVAIFKDKRVNRFSEHKLWIKELKEKFPTISHEKFWSLVKKIDNDGWKLTTKLKNIPLRSFHDLKDFKADSIFKALKILPYFIKNTESYLNDISDQDYKALINEILFITAQNNIADTPMLMGAMGLNYPADTSYAIGGMKAFVESLAAKCSHKFYRHQVSAINAIEEGKKGFVVQTNHGDFKATKVVSTLHTWNHEKLFVIEPKLQAFFQSGNLNRTIEDCWSAFMIYLTIPKDKERASLYYQIHCDSIPNSGTHSFFVSISHHDDNLRTNSPERQVVTISTHTKPAQWLNISKEDYKSKKEETSNFILSELCKYFSLQMNDLQDIQTGSPTTFIRYTKRYQGLVGGIPHSIRRNPLTTVISTNPLKNFYMIGDTQFPGQGIGAVVLGAQNLVHHLTKKN